MCEEKQIEKKKKVCAEKKILIYRAELNSSSCNANLVKQIICSVVAPVLLEDSGLAHVYNILDSGCCYLLFAFVLAIRDCSMSI